ncbi:MAG: tail fiber domain-containing protein, partial [Pseudobdellovibrionaceae bacterium]
VLFPTAITGAEGVGIGTSTPDAALNIVQNIGNTGASVHVNNSSSTAAADANLFLQTALGSTIIRHESGNAAVGYFEGVDQSDGKFKISSYPGAPAFSASGLVYDGVNNRIGIGTASPARLFHVNGPMRITPAALPSSPAAGELAFDSGASNALKYHNGSAWVSLTGGGGGDFMKDGSVAMTGALNMGSQNITSIGSNMTSAGNITFSTPSGNSMTLGGSTGAASTYLQSGTGGTTVTSSGTSATSINITSSGVGGGITLSQNASGAINIGNASATGAVTIQGAGTNTLTSSKVAAGAVTVSATGGTTATTLITSNGTGSSAVNITSTGANSGIRLAPNGTGVVTVSGALTATGNITAPAYFYSSDRRLKENIEAVDPELILKLRGVTFDWKSTGKPEIGLIAQEVEDVVPVLVQTNPETGMKSVKYGNIVALAIEAIKTLWNKVSGHDAEIERLAKENAELKQQMLELQKNQELILKKLDQIQRAPAAN